jgi:hypothetical protein
VHVSTNCGEKSECQPSMERLGLHEDGAKLYIHICGKADRCSEDVASYHGVCWTRAKANAVLLGKLCEK